MTKRTLRSFSTPARGIKNAFDECPGKLSPADLLSLFSADKNKIEMDDTVVNVLQHSLQRVAGNVDIVADEKPEDAANEIEEDDDEEDISPAGSVRMLSSCGEGLGWYYEHIDQQMYGPEENCIDFTSDVPKWAKYILDIPAILKKEQSQVS